MHLLRLLLACFAFSVSLSAATTWHVSGTGDDVNDGTSSSTAFRTLKKAAAALQPGDTLLVGDGTYTDETPGVGQAVLEINLRGSPEAWTTIKAAPGAKPVLRPTAWHGIRSISGTYIIIDGLSIIGDTDSITHEEAMTDGLMKEKDGKRYPGSPRFNTNGISIDGRKAAVDQKPHHFIVRNCTVAKMPGTGIGAIEFDHLLIEDNIVYDNCWRMRFAGSGITTLFNWASDDAPGYHVVIQRNLVWNNKTLVPWSAIGKPSDGNGILLDVSDKKGAAAANVTGVAAKVDPNAGAMKPERPEWKYRALIANNISAYNGGSGIHTFRSSHVDIINNTTIGNGTVVGYQELFPNRSDDVVILNNIIIPRKGGKVTDNNKNTNVRWDYNIYPEAQKVFVGANDIVGDPMLIKITDDLRESDLRLAAGSPALNSGTNDLPQATDIKGTPRPQGPARDRGAYEQ